MKIIFLILISSRLFAFTDLYYEIHFTNINKIIETKLKKLKSKPFCKIYSYRGKTSVEVDIDDRNIKKMLSSICLKKHNVVQGANIDDLLLNFEFKEKYSRFNVYVDKTGVSEINEIWMAKSKNELEIIEKRSIGTTRIKYKYSSKKLIEVTMSSFEGAQSIESNHRFAYSEEKASDMILSLESEYTQKLSKRDIGDFQRIFKEIITFENYKVDKNIALNYFNKN